MFQEFHGRQHAALSGLLLALACLGLTKSEPTML